MKAKYSVDGLMVAITTTLTGVNVDFGDIMSSDRDIMATETKECFDTAILSCKADGKVVKKIGDNKALVGDTADALIFIIQKDETFGRFSMDIIENVWLELSHDQQEELVGLMFNGLIDELNVIERFKRVA